MWPESTTNVPAIALSKVDLPEPFVPMTMTHDPSSIITSTPSSERTSFGVPGLNTFEIPRVSSMRGLSLPLLGFRNRMDAPYRLAYPLQESGKDKRQEYKDRRDQFQIIRIQTPAERNCDEQAKEHRSHNGPDDCQS